MTALPVCPRCEQVHVHQMRIIKSGMVFQVCGECDATWPEDHDLVVPGFDEDLTTFLNHHGVALGWGALEYLNPPPVKTHEQKSELGAVLSARCDHWRPRPGSDPDSALAEWHDRTFEFDTATVVLAGEAMADILRHHHLNFWNGSVKRIQTFFAGRPSITDVIAAVHTVLNQNRSTVLEHGPGGTYRIDGEFNGAGYALHITAGAVRTFYPHWI